MDTSLAAAEPALHRRFCFFALGLVAVLVGSDLEIPARCPSSFPLPAAGDRLSGVAWLRKSGPWLPVGGDGSWTAMGDVGAALPIYCFFCCSGRGLDRFQCRGDRRTYGSDQVPSTFITAESFLDVTGTPHDASWWPPSAPMESPAIIRWPACW